jgi:hypothetical protein
VHPPVRLRLYGKGYTGAHHPGSQRTCALGPARALRGGGDGGILARHTAHHLTSTQRSTRNWTFKLLDTSAGSWFYFGTPWIWACSARRCGIIWQVKGPASLKTAVRGVFQTTAVPLRAHIHFCLFESTPSAVSYRCRPAFSRRGGRDLSIKALLAPPLADAVSIQ